LTRECVVDVQRRKRISENGLGKCAAAAAAAAVVVAAAAVITRTYTRPYLPAGWLSGSMPR
jgi:hypothetical protein